MSLPGQTVTRVMERNTPKKGASKSKQRHKVFMEISKYFSHNQWKKLSYSEKITCVYLKRNYTTMSALGLTVTPPTFMRVHKEEVLNDDDSDRACSHEVKDELPEKSRKGLMTPKKPTQKNRDPESVAEAPGEEPAARAECLLGEASTSTEKSSVPDFRKKKMNIWSDRLRKQKNVVVYEEISEPEEEDYFD
ncbi:putative protein SSX6 [Octodon degus]|uniref:KRAB-related domain-containing protein n=1 Tax=Octodon degus TaxID=10160 RepID=A0A6P3FA77_OCTDE|nr:putative protein SSX6 [Octodon degus]